MHYFILFTFYFIECILYLSLHGMCYVRSGTYNSNIANNFTSQNEMEMFVSYESVFNTVYDQISV